MTTGRRTQNAVDFSITFEDVTGRQWKREKINRAMLKAVQEKETELEKTFDTENVIPETDDGVEATEKTFQISQAKLFDVRLASIIPHCGDADGNALTVDDLDVGEAQHLYQAFWRNVWGLDPKGNLH